MEVFSHRGISLGRENAGSAFRAAKELGIGFEFDVRRTGSNSLVAFHDTTLERITNGSGLLIDTPDEVLDTLINTEYGDEYPTEGILYYQEALQYGFHIPLIADTKEHDNPEQVVEQVAELDLFGQVLFTADTVEALQAIKGRDPRAKVGFETSQITLPQIRGIAQAGIDYITPNVDIVDRDFVSCAHDNGMQVYPFFVAARKLWIPSVSRAVEQVADFGVSGVIVNRPREVLEFLGQKPPQTATVLHKQVA